MAQILFSRNPTGRIGLGLFLLAIGAFLYSVFDPVFGPLALGCIVAGALVAAALLRHRPTVPHIAPWTVDGPERGPRLVEPR